METLGNILHSVGETVGLVPHHDEAKEKKEEEEEQARAPASSTGAAPSASSPAYADWQKEHQLKEGGILSSIANAARNVLVPPPLDTDPVDEVVVPVVPVRTVPSCFSSPAFFPSPPLLKLYIALT